MTTGVIGILGGGQLGRMLALAGHNLALTTRCYDTAADAVAGHVTQLHVDSFEQPERLDQFLSGVTAVTYEFENVPVALAERINATVPCYPPPAALRAAQDRIAEKSLFRRLGIQTPGFAAVDTLPQLHEAATDLGLPAVLKTRRLGYDGKGQCVVRDKGEIDKAWATLVPTPRDAADLILEQFVPFTRELSVIGVRSATGEFRAWPITENHHAGGILRTSIAPAQNLPAPVAHQATSACRAVMDHLGYVGVLAIELFQLGSTLLANEMAPRVHNSGHWTQDGAATSQFENHLRAVAGLPLGDCSLRDTSPTAACAMLNLIGQMPARDTLLAACNARARLHDYGKQPRAGRKLGHVNITASSVRELNIAIGELRAAVGR